MKENKNQERQKQGNPKNRNTQDQKQHIDNVEFADEFLDLNPLIESDLDNANRNNRRRR